jgi:prepilin-type N-terminal cleavage/methylation domain-containing protein
MTGTAERLRCRQGGLTLIELVIVISLLALIVTIVLPSVANIIGMNLRTTAAEVAGAIRFTYDLAARKNVPFRLVFDLDEQAYWVESASEKYLLDREKTGVSDGRLDEDAEREKERGRSRRFVDRSYIEGGEMWQPKGKPSFSSFAGPYTKKKPLPTDIFFQDVWVAHQDDRVTAGQAYLYCFPTGMTERAVVHIGDDAEDTYTLVVEALTGVVKVHPEYVEAEE